MTSAGFNRRMRKTACPVVWKGHGAQSPCPHPIEALDAAIAAAFQSVAPQDAVS